LNKITANRLLGNGECDISSSSPVCICSPQFFGSECSESLIAVSPYDGQPESGVFHLNSSAIAFSVGYLAAIFVGAAILIVGTVITAYHMKRSKYEKLLQSQLSGTKESSSVSLEEK
jgi:hypothetical protein